MVTRPLILIADDDIRFQELCAAQLRSAGFEVIVAKNGMEAVASAKKQRPALILIDLRMPAKDGLAATLQLKNDPSTHEIKIAFFTFLGNEKDIEIAHAYGAEDFINKEISMADLVAKVRALTNNS